ncbi:MAG: Fe-S cluster assembly protein SufD [Bacilli bacterium]
MTTTTSFPYTEESVIRLFANSPEWFANVRKEALTKAQTLELPKPDKTKITKWDFVRNVQPAASTATLPQAVAEVIGGEEGTHNTLVQVNGTVVSAELQAELAAKGVIFTDLQTAVVEHADLVKKYFGTAVKTEENQLTALNVATVNGGLFLYVPKNVQVEVPLHAVYYFDEKETSLSNRVIVVAEDFAEVTYVENYMSAGSGVAVANIVTEVIVGTNAKVTFGAVDTLGSEVTTYVNRRGAVARDGRLEWALGAMNDGNTVSENITNLNGDNSFADAKMVTVGTGKQTQNFTTSIIHWGKHSEGYILKHGVQGDAATSIFNGIGKIEHGASKSNAEQTSRVLMLNDKARGDANPILLIDEDDVTAGHAASVGKVDALQLFYLMSRGISKTEAEKLVIFGFLAPVVEELPIDQVKNQLLQVIDRKVSR